MGIQYHQPLHLKSTGLDLDYNVFAENQAAAEYALGLLQGSQKKLQNPDLLISPLSAKEAAVSSKIEGTQSTVSDVFLHEAGGRTRHSDIQEVVNYRRTINFAIKKISTEKRITIPMVRQLHRSLLENTRHKGTLGAFRQKDVWIAARAGDPIDKALYIPPHYSQIQSYIDNLWEYINNGKENTLLKAGVIHYQFEAVHPFEDGNGRIGRLLIPLILHHKNQLSTPILYISGYMENHRDEYINSLHDVDRTGRIEPWLSFFFKSVGEQLKETQSIVERIYALYDGVRGTFGMTKSPYLIPFLDFVFATPMFTVPQATQQMRASSRLTTIRLIKLFQEKNIIRESPIHLKRAKLYAFEPLLKILK